MVNSFEDCGSSFKTDTCQGRNTPKMHLKENPMKIQYIKAFCAYGGRRQNFHTCAGAIEPQKVGVNLVLVSDSDERDLLTALNTHSILGGSSGTMRTPSPSCPYYFAGAAKHQFNQKNDPSLLF